IPWIFIHGYPLTVPLGLVKCVRFQPQKISIGVTFTSLESRVLNLGENDISLSGTVFPHLHFIVRTRALKLVKAALLAKAAFIGCRGRI
ncbi:MAG: hypothetical protein LAT55_08325, partial [Opitutales bacterium]|nr:hypothetical protein [Opitutales bacterium]